ncbi:UNVERIFIED_CONTAM: hypothetical protein GTU68_032897 [Idotea baltica]|nr:hypothetical protein [Idotea baltica]
MLDTADGKTYVDCTFGAGGYSRAILESSNCNLIAFDRDPNVRKFADNLKGEFGDRFSFHNVDFAQIKGKLADQKVDGIVYDLGVSSMQIDTPERGFSFQKDGPLDMRMDTSLPLTAEMIVNTYPKDTMADIFYDYGDERKSRHIAHAIVKYREEAEEPISTTLQLAKIIEKVLGRGKKTHPATKCFQALRIYINDEFGQVERSLADAPDLLNLDGKIVVVTFHSGEDKIVKKYFNELSGNLPSPNRHDPSALENNSQKYNFKLISKKSKSQQKMSLARMSVTICQITRCIEN